MQSERSYLAPDAYDWLKHARWLDGVVECLIMPKGWNGDRFSYEETSHYAVKKLTLVGKRREATINEAGWTNVKLTADNIRFQFDSKDHQSEFCVIAVDMRVLCVNYYGHIDGDMNNINIFWHSNGICNADCPPDKDYIFPWLTIESPATSKLTSMPKAKKKLVKN